MSRGRDRDRGRIDREGQIDQGIAWSPGGREAADKEIPDNQMNEEVQGNQENEEARDNPGGPIARIAPEEAGISCGLNH
jgi:hypothetical protein